MATRHIALIISVIVLAGCSGATAPVQPESTPDSTVSSPATPVLDSPATPEPPSHSHEAERIALDFIDDIKDGQYVNSILEIDADTELSPQDRVAAFRMLEQFIRTQKWKLWFTSIEVFEGHEDSVDCYLRGTDGGLLVLLLGYHYDIAEWRIDAYEIPELTFSRPENEPYADYVARNVAESKAGAQPFKDGVQGDGRYFIEY
jgi:hypothetical protein